MFVTIGVQGEDEADLADAARSLAAAGHPVIAITLGKKIDLGQEFFRWELATAAAGAVLGIQPFDQPDVQLAKDLARKAMDAAAGAAAGSASTRDRRAVGMARRRSRRWLSSVRPNDYIGVHAYLSPAADIVDALQRLREPARQPDAAWRRRSASGPRFLHSTGQLHKGGPDTGLFLQLVDEPQADLPVPETTYTFGELIRAQAAGDAMALEQRGRRVLRINLGATAEGGTRDVGGMMAELDADSRAAIMRVGERHRPARGAAPRGAARRVGSISRRRP